MCLHGAVLTHCLYFLADNKLVNRPVLRRETWPGCVRRFSDRRSGRRPRLSGCRARGTKPERDVNAAADGSPAAGPQAGQPGGPRREGNRRGAGWSIGRRPMRSWSPGLNSGSILSRTIDPLAHCRRHAASHQQLCAVHKSVISFTCVSSSNSRCGVATARLLCVIWTFHCYVKRYEKWTKIAVNIYTTIVPERLSYM